MALVNFLPRWARRLTAMPLWGGLVAAIEETFAEIDADRIRLDANTVLAEADDAGLARWGLDLRQNPRAGGTTEQYRGLLTSIYQGNAINHEAYASALDRWGLAYELYEGTDGAAMWDMGFYDSSAIDIPARSVLVIFADPFGGTTPTSGQKAAAKQQMVNALADAARIKARGVYLRGQLPASVF
jgi:hypothetical protein